MEDYIKLRVLPKFGCVYEINIELDEFAKDAISAYGRQFYIENWVNGNLSNVKEYEEVNDVLDDVLSQINVEKAYCGGKIVVYVKAVKHTDGENMQFLSCLDIVYEDGASMTLAVQDATHDCLISLMHIAKEICQIYPCLTYFFVSGMHDKSEKEGE